MSSYHGWTHRPKAEGGTDPIGLTALDVKVFQAYSTATQVIPTGTTANTLSFAEASGAWPTTFNLVGNAAGAHDGGLTTTQEWFVYEGGLFFAGFAVVWETGNYAKRARIRQRFGSSGGTSTPLVAAHGTYGELANTFVAQNAYDTSLSTPHSMWDMAVVRPDLQTDPRFAVEATQTSGSNKNITFVNLVLIRLAAVGEFGYL